MLITIIGTGLIGGSIALALREKNIAGTIIGVDNDPGNIEKALSLNLIDRTASFDEAIDTAQLIILAIPVDAIRLVLPQVLDRVTGQVVMELGSTKANILEAVAEHPRRGRLVPAHPMAGTEYSGPEAAVKDLFKGKTMVLCDVRRSDEDAFEMIGDLVEELEMRTVFMNASEHDVHTAYVSHISHITSFALALTVLEKEKEEGHIFELASGGFESTVRLAKSSPDMWVPVFRQNRENVLDVLEEHIHQLQNMQKLLENEDYDSFYKLIQRANKIRKILR
ncbi:MAG TPA: prephenate dehydrogenase [Anseongella sp.]